MQQPVFNLTGNIAGAFMITPRFDGPIKIGNATLLPCTVPAWSSTTLLVPGQLHKHHMIREFDVMSYQVNMARSGMEPLKVEGVEPETVLRVLNKLWSQYR